MQQHRVYWTEEATARFRDFVELTDMLEFMQQLRQRQYADGSVTYVTSAYDNSNSVGKQGVDVTDATYDWKKRRP